MTGTADVEELMIAGRDHAFAGRFSEAEAILRAVLDQVRGSGSADESRACGNLGSVFAARGRRFEAILLYRRGLAIDRERGGDPLVELRHLANISAMFAEIELWPALEKLLREFDGLVSNLAAADREGAADLTLWPRIQMALARDEHARARRDAESFFTAFESRVDPAAASVREALRADLLLAEERLDAALAVLEAAAADPDLPTLDRLHLDLRIVDCLRLAGRPGDAVERARGSLDRLQAVVARDGAGELSVELATELGKFLGSFVDHRESARRAYDLAADAVLTRMASLHWCAKSIPELCELSEEDRVWIRDLRAQYLRDQQVLLDLVAELLSDHSSPRVSYLFAGEGGEHVIRLCAWCGRLCTTGDRWFPLAQYVPVRDSLAVSHGMCPDCQKRQAV